MRGNTEDILNMEGRIEDMERKISHFLLPPLVPTSPRKRVRSDSDGLSSNSAYTQSFPFQLPVQPRPQLVQEPVATASISLEGLEQRMLVYLENRSISNEPPVDVLHIRRSVFAEPMPSASQLLVILLDLSKKSVIRKVPASPQDIAEGRKKPKWEFVTLL